jgi:hypothetical protein
MKKSRIERALDIAFYLLVGFLLQMLLPWDPEVKQQLCAGLLFVVILAMLVAAADMLRLLWRYFVKENPK